MLLPGLLERIVMAVMGWSSVVMAKHDQRVTDPMRPDVGRKISYLLWSEPALPQ